MAFHEEGSLPKYRLGVWREKKDQRKFQPQVPGKLQVQISLSFLQPSTSKLSQSLSTDHPAPRQKGAPETLYLSLWVLLVTSGISADGSPLKSLPSKNEPSQAFWDLNDMLKMSLPSLHPSPCPQVRVQWEEMDDKHINTQRER